MQISSDELRQRILQWSADEELRRATSQRMNAAVQEQIAHSEARFSGLLIDLLESQRPLTIFTSHRRRHDGVIGALGKDFCAISDERSSVLIRLNTIDAVQLEAHPRNVPVASDRTLSDNRPTLSNILDELAADRIKIRFVLRADETVREGELLTAGNDMCCLAVSASSPTVLYVPVHSFDEVSLT